jgi:hypothetical protein
MRVRLEYNVGYDTVGLYDVLEFYNDPFKEKVISIGIGIDEIDIIYIKGVNEKFNLLSREWSNPVIFSTNDLVFEKDSDVSFLNYYIKNVADFGRMLISQVKEGRLPAYGGKTPTAPILNEGDLRVVQINTQLNSTLDSERYISITSEIASVKSNITATRNTISNIKRTRALSYTIESFTYHDNTSTGYEWLPTAWVAEERRGSTGRVYTVTFKSSNLLNKLSYKIYFI